MRLHKSFSVPETATLEERARAINWLFEEVNNVERTLTCRRGELGRELLKARTAVDTEHGPGHWEDWCKENIHRSQRDIRKLIAIAAAADPASAAAAEREAAKVRMASVREERANTADVRPARAEAREEKDSSADQRAHVRAIPNPERPTLSVVPKADPVSEAIEMIDAVLADLSATERAAVLAHYTKENRHAA